MAAKRKSQESDAPHPYAERQTADSPAKNPVVWVVGATGLAIGAGLAALFQSPAVISRPPETTPEVRPVEQGTPPYSAPKPPVVVPNDPG